MGGIKEAVVRTVQDLIDIVPAHALVRRHASGDFCVCLPLLRCTKTIPTVALESLPYPPLSPNFCADPQELRFVTLRKSPFSEHFVEVFSPFPGHGQRIRGEDYPVMRLSCGQTDFVFPPAHYADVDDDEESVEDRSSVELRNIKKGDVGAVATPKAITVGEVYLVRGHSYKVVSVTGGGMPYKVFGGDDLLVFDKPFPFNAKKTKGHLCLPVLIRAKHGFLPMSALDNFEPIKFRDLTVKAVAAKLGQGSFEMEFCSLAFNDVLVCHRDSYLHPNVS